MRIVVDTNIVFSALLNANTILGEILLTLQDKFDFFAPELLRQELERYREKLGKASKLTDKQLNEASIRLLDRLTLVSEDLISELSWSKAHLLTKDVDEDDTPFVALSIELNAKLWTGDKKLTAGILGKGAEIVITIAQLFDYLEKQ